MYIQQELCIYIASHLQKQKLYVPFLCHSIFAKLEWIYGKCEEFKNCFEINLIAEKNPKAVSRIMLNSVFLFN